MIENIVQGMTAAQVFSILNRMIDEHNQMMTALGGALVNGQFDYNALVNKPTINSVELIGDLTQADLEISVDAEVINRLNSFGQLVSTMDSTLQQKVSTSDLTTALQAYAKTTDIPDVSGFVTTTTMNNALAQKVDTTTYNNTIAQLNTAIGSKASAGEVPTTVQWNNLLTQMEAKVTQAGNSATAAANSATTCSTQCGIATQKAQEASQSAQSVSGALTRIDNLEATVNGTQQTTGLAARTTNLEKKVGTAGEKVDIATDLKETRVKSNDILAALKEVGGEVYDKLADIVALDVNY